MPKIAKTSSAAPSTISTPPPVSENPASVSAPVSASASVSVTSDQPAWSATREPLSEGQSLRDRDLFEIFSRFLEWEKAAHPPFDFGCSFLFFRAFPFDSAFGSVGAPGFHTRPFCPFEIGKSSNPRSGIF